jgi:hypothetical protein
VFVKVRTLSPLTVDSVGEQEAADAGVGIADKDATTSTGASNFLNLIAFNYLPFTFTVTLTFWPGFNPVTVAFALFLFVDVLGLVEITAFDGTFAAAAFAAVATFAATDAEATAFIAAAVFVTDSAFTATASVV